MAKFKSSFFNDESHNYTKDVVEKIYKDLKVNPTYVVARCEKDGESNSPAIIKLDTEVDTSVKRNWEINDKSDILKICEGYLEYKPDSVILYSFNLEAPLELIVKDYFTEEVLTYIWNSESKSLKLK